MARDGNIPATHLCDQMVCAFDCYRGGRLGMNLQPDTKDLLRSLKIDRSDMERQAIDAEVSGRSIAMPLLLAVAVGLAVVFATLWWNARADGERAASPTRGSAQAGQVQAPPPGRLVASGYVVARRQATIASEITGRIVEVPVEEGQYVNRGDVIAVLDARVAQEQRSIAEGQQASAMASVELAQVRLAEAERRLERAEQLFARGFSTNADLTAAQAAVESLRAELSGNRANVASAASAVRRAQLEVGRYVVRAPFSGIVISKNAQPGEVISPISAGGGFTRTGLCTLVDASSLEIEVDVSEQHISEVYRGQPVEISFSAYPDKTYEGKVIATVPSADRNRATVKVRIGLDKLDDGIFPDMGVKVLFQDVSR